MTKATENTPAVFIEQTRAYEIFQLMLQGKSIQEIANQIGTPEEGIRRTISNERLKLTAGMQEMQEQFMGITYARTEWLISKVFPLIESQAVAGQVDKNLIKIALDIMKFQTEVVLPSKIDSKSSADVVINQTFVAGSNMYEEAMTQMHSEYLDSIRVEKEIPMRIVASPQMARLEELAETYGVNVNEPSSTDSE